MATAETTEREDAGAATELELAVSGMTCASCARRIEKVLGRQTGITAAAVNFATNKATIAFDPARVSPGDLVAAVGPIGRRHHR